MLKIGEIRELIRLLDDTSLAEIRIETEDMKLLLKKPDAPAVVPQAAAPVMPAASPLASAPAPAEPAAAPAAAPSAPAVVPAPEPAEDEANIHIVKSPMVGTFYRAPAPDAPPYVEVGTKVTEKTVVCIVEAMKLMNEIEAEVSGEVVEVLAENGQLVEYGQPLFKIKRA
ncbi:MAG: acetyl-CoA carboxylase biotin carboxyl carrier protein [Alicyclobacillus macrosporangiidus]|uniref:acetyl-CoA carboxylase biotin carboxyl carrier protein n=1 Tax=Alicyclobacillus macrosporangiidus TaxID=392015 RepID=UPI0026ED36A4|nr:acetyl-CoA carboxylase biotin carboxyl carrier protein [Alicyclobacillus macrosporangiidus]MCL6598441.1 acetyl-CoA carboxylase biotin carboxyl carrier protein [Alicyclobacillus macrosporangiidus]